MQAGATEPRLIQGTKPKYTPQAIKMNIEGTTSFRVIVDTNGKVTEVTELVSHFRMKTRKEPTESELAEFTKASISLVTATKEKIHQWEFTPACMNGNETMVVIAITIEFHLPPPRDDLQQKIYHLPIDEDIEKVLLIHVKKERTMALKTTSKIYDIEQLEKEMLQLAILATRIPPRRHKRRQRKKRRH